MWAWRSDHVWLACLCVGKGSLLGCFWRLGSFGVDCGSREEMCWNGVELRKGSTAC